MASFIVQTGEIPRASAFISAAVNSDKESDSYLDQLIENPFAFEEANAAVPEPTYAPQPTTSPPKNVCPPGQDNSGWGCDPPNVPHRIEFWRALSGCESSDGRDSSNGSFHGFFQFMLSSWQGAGGTGDPHVWTWEEQLWRAKVWASKTNPYSQWPVCWPRAVKQQGTA